MIEHQAINHSHQPKLKLGSESISQSINQIITFIAGSSNTKSMVSKNNYNVHVKDESMRVEARCCRLRLRQGEGQDCHTLQGASCGDRCERSDHPGRKDTANDHFQIYSIILWCTEVYYVYAGAILFIATVSAGITLHETRKNLKQLNEIARYTCNVNVLRGGSTELVNSSRLVPGDIVELQNSLILPCDFTLLNGTIVLNESMLTGESIPVTKYPLTECAGDNLSVNGEINKRCAISGGTKVVKTQCLPGERILAMVTRTGWTTTKGELVLSMLYPKETNFKFFQQSIKFLLVLCSIALVGFSISVWRMIKNGTEVNEVIVRSLDLITIVVPPALPMAQSVGQGFSILRLKAQSIFCISPPRVSMGGKIEVFCFDKTGTLTEDGLDLMGVLPSYSQNFGEMVKDIGRMTGPLFLTLATCHTLAYIEDKVSGDPLEEKIFESTKAHLDDNHPHYKAAIRLDVKRETFSETKHFPIPTNEIEQCLEIGLVEKFEFQSALQRMSVIIRGHGLQGKDLAIVKGSPEKIKALSVASSLPSDYDSVLDQYTKKGYRVLAAGYKDYQMPNDRTKDEIRDEVECDLHFLGFIIMENKIKPQTPPALQVLKKANIRLIMVTGDNVLTGVSVASECGLILDDRIIFMSEVSNGVISWRDCSSNPSAMPYKLDPVSLTIEGSDNEDFVLAVTGDAWKILYDDKVKIGPNITFTRLLQKGHVFARMTPDQKQNLVEDLIAANLYVGMCGDGANDCGALKAAHVGISLSLAEASIAAPFTSTVTDVSCTHKLIREGRASLAVSFKLFQFIGMYSLIQFTTVILLYLKSDVLGNYQYLYQDLWMIFPLVIFMGRTEPCSKLSVKRPSSRLISPAVIGSLFVHVALTAGFQSIIFVFVQKEKWYTPSSDDGIISYVVTSLFLYGNFQYLIMCFIYSFGKPFLKLMYTNKLLFGWFLLNVVTTTLLLVIPNKPLYKFFQLEHDLPAGWMNWVYKLLILLAINIVLSIGLEYLIIFIKQQTSAKNKKNKQARAREHLIKSIQFAEDNI
ncbi:P-type ATPase [Heterostelium album PN500]|uniref:P-type ATPase n=1 Tax=Heterostelium pallidum (strain ATCC 26659 / Pp 5 / PN500) TaxID=670386 RepID=D3AY71_HETP5|nr:P-type ATPase [Heterostelium album PN500]EFA85898.1 P-type ATPase [Heterostelium album PN500]|eukprot:XP_020438004.1 P-type ATPase [Heterostelium album PN500]